MTKRLHHRRKLIKTYKNVLPQKTTVAVEVCMQRDLFTENDKGRWSWEKKGVKKNPTP